MRARERPAHATPIPRSPLKAWVAFTYIVKIPPKGRGFLKPLQQFHLLSLVFLMPMVSNIALHHRGRHRIPHRPNKVPILPKLSLPQMFPQLWILSKQLTGRSTFKDPHHLGNRILGRKIQKNMHRLFGQVQFNQLKAKVLRNLPKHFLRASSNILPNNPPPVFRCSYQMVFRVVNRMASSFNRHPPRVSQPGSASGRLNFSSPLNERGFQVRFSDPISRKEVFDSAKT